MNFFNEKCPCGSGLKYKKCCKLYHEGKLPKNALELMKSRYSAYAVGRCDYILKTTYNPPQNLEQFKEEIASFSKHTTFEKLSILEFLEDEISFVTFHAKLSSKNQDISFSEKSRFIKKEGRWFYESGAVF